MSENTPTIDSPSPSRLRRLARHAADPEIWTVAAEAFVAELAARFTPRIDELLAARRQRQVAVDARVCRGEPAFDFLPETRHVRDGDWRAAPLPADLLDRRVEITGPVDRKMVINALNSGANVFMADFEDATAPTYDNVVSGQKNLKDAVRRTITFHDPEKGKSYELAQRVATLMVRPRGLHLPEHHVVFEGGPLHGRSLPGALVDFGLFFFHNARELLARGTGPYFYLPKLESHIEARLWEDVFVASEAALGIPAGSIRATVLIETLPASFEMDEILYELRSHSAGLNCGRWDYIFSFIKKLHADPTCVLPDRSQVSMDQPFMAAYTQLLVKTCHRRGVHAMGGMAAQIPIKDDPEKNAQALAKVTADKLREVKGGHDGTWVAHPGLVPVARAVFDAHMSGPHQIDEQRPDLHVTAAELLAAPKGTRTEAGLRHNIRVGIQYLEAWLRGSGCVPLYDLMEDAATAEISRSQAWQWLRHRASVGDAPLTPERFRSILADEMKRLAEAAGSERLARGRFAEAERLFAELATAPELADFLALPAYELLRAHEAVEPPDPADAPR